jgi:hypothetical protein
LQLLALGQELAGLLAVAQLGQAERQALADAERRPGAGLGVDQGERLAQRRQRRPRIVGGEEPAALEQAVGHLRRLLLLAVDLGGAGEQPERAFDRHMAMRGFDFGRTRS